MLPWSCGAPAVNKPLSKALTYIGAPPSCTATLPLICWKMREVLKKKKKKILYSILEAVPDKNVKDKIFLFLMKGLSWYNHKK